MTAKSVKPILTPYERREEIIAEANKHPTAQARERSLRRRLTVLDRTLDDREARALDRLTVWLIAAVNPAAAVCSTGTRIDCGRGTGVQGEAFRREVALALAVQHRLRAGELETLRTMLEVLDPQSFNFGATLSFGQRGAMKDLAAKSADLYEALTRRSS